jgi:sugar-specific transcriptional regulator TrmB
MKIGLLVECGFTENQAKLYVLLIKQPGLSAGQIAKKLSIDRSFTYNIIESLIKKGLIYFSLEKNKKIFFPESPKKILEELESKKSKVSSAIEELEKIKEESKKGSSVEIYEGKSALKKYLSEITSANNFLTLGGGGELNIFNILKYEYPHYIKKIKKSKVSGKAICSHQNKKFWKSLTKGGLLEIKSLEGAEKENSITILKDKVIFSEETETPNIIIINNRSHAHSLSHYFDYLWKIAKE